MNPKNLIPMLLILMSFLTISPLNAQQMNSYIVVVDPIQEVVKPDKVYEETVYVYINKSGAFINGKLIEYLESLGCRAENQLYLDEVAAIIPILEIEKPQEGKLLKAWYNFSSQLIEEMIMKGINIRKALIGLGRNTYTTLIYVYKDSHTDVQRYLEKNRDFIVKRIDSMKLKFLDLNPTFRVCIIVLPITYGDHMRCSQYRDIIKHRLLELMLKYHLAGGINTQGLLGYAEIEISRTSIKHANLTLDEVLKEIKNATRGCPINVYIVPYKIIFRPAILIPGTPRTSLTTNTMKLTKMDYLHVVLIASIAVAITVGIAVYKRMHR